MALDIPDCATALEGFIIDSANLPAEISYMLEEIQAIDKDMQRHLTNVNTKESALQKQVKNHGSLVAHPKEQEYATYNKKHMEMCMDLQQKKMTHADRALDILDRQLKKLDDKIRLMQTTGQLDDDGDLPSVYSRKSENQKLALDAPTGNMPLRAANLSALNANARLNPHATPIIRQPQPRHVQQAVPSISQAQRVAAPATPSLVSQAQKISQEREQSTGADSKRRKLNMSATGINLPSQPSSLRQSSMGPGTPKAGTPTGSRAGSIPRTSASQSTKKPGPVGVTKKQPTHQAVSKLKTKHNKHLKLSQAGSRKLKSGSPAMSRGGRAGTEASEDSVLSSADASDTDTSQAKRRRTKKQAQAAQKSVEVESEGEDDGEEEGDDKVYCYCNQPSYGEMVGCENDNCKREWFHISCLGLKTVPSDEHWFCPECRTELAERKKRK